MTEIGLQADMQKAKQGQDLIDVCIAWRSNKIPQCIICASVAILELWCNEVVLHRLEKLHGEEEKDTTCQFKVTSSRINPPSREQANRGKAR